MAEIPNTGNNRGRNFHRKKHRPSCWVGRTKREVKLRPIYTPPGREIQRRSDVEARTLTTHSVPKDSLNAGISEEELQLAITKLRYWKPADSDGIPRGYTRRHSQTRLSSGSGC
ncbi:MAG: uncharacterized protein A8A55_1834 [Amphiamblys sp. WSBS2006]|nr:MAG: uncharacterized protein A8A55_1834 [Amphiamblys sp. WSBS2006]